jgi:hypothetical protein
MLIEKIKKAKNLGSIVRSIKLNDEYYDMIYNMTSFLDPNVNLKERLYNIKFDIKQVIICPICNCEKLEWNNKFSLYKNTCNNKNCKSEYRKNNIDNEKEQIRRTKISLNQKNKSPEEKNKIREKIKKTNIEKYGVDSFAKTDAFKEQMIKKFGYISPFSLKETHLKSKETLLERYGVEHNFLIKEVKETKKNTFLEKYGTDIPSKNIQIKNKMKLTNLDKYGGNSPMCDEKVKNKALNTYKINYVLNEDNKNALLKKRETTMMSLYGVKYWIQDSDNFSKLLRYKKTSYKTITINDEDYVLQGYEDYVLLEILIKKYKFDDILISKKDIEKQIGKIFYDYNNKKHRYFPDFYTISNNTVYEVKSNYTYQTDLEINNLKRDSCLCSGFNFEFIIINNDDYKKWNKIIKNKQIINEI